MKSRWFMSFRDVGLLTLLASMASAADAGTWTNLWSTREQQAQQLLDSRNPAAAAPLFSDARRRAYAEMQAGQYAKAAKSLAPFKDADSEYNRGNALAHSGQLREALSAYDAALKTAPGDKDAIRNRDLVRRELERQQQNQSGKQNNGKPGSQGSKGGQSQGGDQSQGGGQSQPGKQSQAGNQPQGAGQSRPDNQSQAANQGQNGSQAQSGSQPRSGQGAQSQAGQPQGSPNQPGGQSDKPSQAANSQLQPGNQQGGHQPQPGGQAPHQQASNRGGAQPLAQTAATPSSGARPGDNSSGEGALASNGQQTNGSTATSGLNAENAQQDADAGLRYRQAQQGRAAPGTSPNDTGRATMLGPDGKTRSSAAVPPPKPPSEQTLALDQWLRGIPDDSGELLRRKFLIEHMLKQRRNEQ
ncbi:MAG TPA: tetratricopeptide repeat protein [Steroidobacteraceae bacterium]